MLALQASQVNAHLGRTRSHHENSNSKLHRSLELQAASLAHLVNELFAYNSQSLFTQLEIKEIKANAVRTTMLHYYNLIAQGYTMNVTAEFYLPEYLAQSIAKNARKLLQHIAYNAYLPHRPLPNSLAHEFEMEIKTMALDAMSSTRYGCLSPFVGTELEFACNSFLASI